MGWPATRVKPRGDFGHPIAFGGGSIWNLFGLDLGGGWTTPKGHGVAKATS
jgi:hypothetical protein